MLHGCFVSNSHPAYSFCAREALPGSCSGVHAGLHDARGGPCDGLLLGWRRYTSC